MLKVACCIMLHTDLLRDIFMIGNLIHSEVKLLK